MAPPALDRVKNLLPLPARQLVRRILPARPSGLWVPPGHFYSPLPDIGYVERHADRIIPDQAAAVHIPGIDLDLAGQRSLLDALAPLVADLGLAETPVQAQARSRRYYTDNVAFGSGDGTFLTLLARHLEPRRWIELGSGHSTCCLLDARDDHLDGRLDVTLVEPYPELVEGLLRPGDMSSLRLLRQGSQEVDPAIFEELDAGDVLFVDSTHVAKTGSDVLSIFFEILPHLRPGVWIHVHDIFPRFEYPLAWIQEGRGWNESYLLRAFLQYNEAFRIRLWPNLLRALEPEDLLARFPGLRANGGGSIWLEKVA